METIKNTPISAIMSTELHTIGSKENLNDARHQFEKYGIRHLPVVDNDKLVGILSLTDLKRLSFGNVFDDEDTDGNIIEMLSVGNIMSSKPLTVSSQDSVYMVADLLTKIEFHALPVKDGDKTVGIVTTTDVLKFFVERVK